MIRLEMLGPFAPTRSCAGCGGYSVVAVVTVNCRLKLRLCAACLGALHDASAPVLARPDREGAA